MVFRRHALLGCALVALGTFAAFASACAPADVEYHYNFDMHGYFDQRTTDGSVTIVSSPEGALVYESAGYGWEDIEAIGTTPIRVTIEASGVPYSYKVVARGYVPYRLDVRPTPINPHVRIAIQLEQDLLYRGGEHAPQPPERDAFEVHPEERNWSFNNAGDTSVIPRSRYGELPYDSRYYDQTWQSAYDTAD